MKRSAVFPVVLWATLALATAGVCSAAPEDDVRIRQLLTTLEEAGSSAQSAAFYALLTPTANPTRAAAFYENEFGVGASKVVIQERERQDRADIPTGEGYRLLVDALVENGARGRVPSWLIDIRKVGEEWRIDDARRIASVENVFRLSVNATHQFTARDLTITSEDLVLTLAEGSVFTIDTDDGVTGLVLFGRGDMKFQPKPETERGQVKIFAGSETLESRFDAAYIRLGDLDAHLDRTHLVERPVDRRDLMRAEEMFREESPKTFALDLADLTRDVWSLNLDPRDFVAEIRTRRFSTLTYVKSSAEAEDIAVFDRKRQRNIAIYASTDKLRARGRFYSEEDLAIYDVVNYDVDVTYSPDRRWINGRVTMHMKMSVATGQVTIRLSDSLVVESIVSNRFGRLFGVRARGQNAVLVNLPSVMLPESELALTISYYGRLTPEAAGREAVGLGAAQDPVDDSENFDQDPLAPRPEASFLYSNQSYWYPQSPTGDYATATIRLTVPVAFDCIASGEPAANSPILIPAANALPAVKLYTFTASRPVRYLSFLVTHFTPAIHSVATFTRQGAGDPTINLSVQSNPRQLEEAANVAGRLTDIVQFYQSLIGDAPYQGLSVAVVEGLVPGGHSPAYLALVTEPLPGTPNSWRDDPASFRTFPEFVLAHEVAHQWWGQGVGWGNYHEQWLSEGFAQYFAALYAERRRGDETFRSMMRQMRKGAIGESDQGPIYLGYRLGHIRRDGRVFRALVYNKGAIVLHMLRRLVGDEPFFRGIRRFYADSHFKRVGTEDLRRAMEEETGRPLDRFFERWIYGATLPQLTFSYSVAPQSPREIVMTFDQAGEELFDVPVTVTLQYADKRSVDVVVPVTERSVTVRVPLDAPLRGVEVSKDDGTLAEVRKVP